MISFRYKTFVLRKNILCYCYLRFGFLSWYAFNDYSARLSFPFKLEPLNHHMALWEIVIPLYSSSFSDESKVQNIFISLKKIAHAVGTIFLLIDNCLLDSSQRGFDIVMLSDNVLSLRIFCSYESLFQRISLIQPLLPHQLSRKICEAYNRLYGRMVISSEWSGNSWATEPLLRLAKSSQE
jgi:hypothetical protein